MHFATSMSANFASLLFSNSSSGVYQITVGQNQVMNVYCQMSSVSNCSGGGWTMVIKIDGSQVRGLHDAIRLYSVIVCTNRFKLGVVVGWGMVRKLILTYPI